MGIEARRIAGTAALVTTGAAVLLAALTPGVSGTAASAAGAPGHGAAGSAAGAPGHAEPRADAGRYWTPALMRRAIPAGPVSLVTPMGQVRRIRRAGPMTLAGPTAPAGRASAAIPVSGQGGTGSSWPDGGPVARATGKVFFTLAGADYVCSAAAVTSPRADVVVTAGHCVSDGAGHWATNWTFVPGYTDGTAPYGRWAARHFFTPPQWANGAAQGDDVAFVTVSAATGATAGALAGNWGLGISFGAHPAQEAVFGYPAESPYNGQELSYCDGATRPDPYHATNDLGVACSMTEGASGGPWLSGFDASSGSGTITSVSSFKYGDGSPVLYGPPLGPEAAALYRQAEHA